jgi:ubiquinone/menaquinone biosynthesis C-methylase UbiE
MRNRFGYVAAVVVAAFILTAGFSGAAQQPAPERPPQNINERWRAEQIEPLVEMLESESRSIYRERNLLAAIAGPLPGAVVADVGAGSGFMTLLFAQMVGPQGKVYAVDINPGLLDYIRTRAQQQGLENIQTILADEKDSRLPPHSVDLVFLCDTYHHFEYPRETMASIHRALKPGGQLVLVEFHRHEGHSPDWVLEHVRGNEQQFVREITAAGFELTNQHNLTNIPDNYILRFRKLERSQAGARPRHNGARPPNVD